jgi:hypothetical protein
MSKAKMMLINTRFIGIILNCAQIVANVGCLSFFKIIVGADSHNSFQEPPQFMDFFFLMNTCPRVQISPKTIIGLFLHFS